MQPLFTCDINFKANLFSESAHYQILWSILFLAGRFVQSSKCTFNKTWGMVWLFVVSPGFIDLHSHRKNITKCQVNASDGLTTYLESEVGVLHEPYHS